MHSFEGHLEIDSLPQVILSCRVGLIWLLIVAHEIVQMCSVDVFASGLVEESDDWENICQKAYTLD